MYRSGTLEAFPKNDSLPGNGEFANVASHWLEWTLKRDKKAGAMFAGKNCSLSTNSNWDVKSKGIKE